MKKQLDKFQKAIKSYDSYANFRFSKDNTITFKQIEVLVKYGYDRNIIFNWTKYKAHKEIKELFKSN